MNPDTLNKPGESFDRDLFGNRITDTKPTLEETLARPDLPDVIACARLLQSMSPLLRGDDTAAGKTILLDGLPAVFDVGMDHRRRGSYKIILGWEEDSVIQLLASPLPSEEMIAAAMSRRASELAPRLRAAAEMMEELVGGGHSENPRSCQNP